MNKRRFQTNLYIESLKEPKFQDTTENNMRFLIEFLLELEENFSEEEIMDIQIKLIKICTEGEDNKEKRDNIRNVMTKKLRLIQDKKEYEEYKENKIIYDIIDNERKEYITSRKKKLFNQYKLIKEAEERYPYPTRLDYRNKKNIEDLKLRDRQIEAQFRQLLVETSRAFAKEYKNEILKNKQKNISDNIENKKINNLIKTLKQEEEYRKQIKLKELSKEEKENIRENRLKKALEEESYLPIFIKTIRDEVEEYKIKKAKRELKEKLYIERLSYTTGEYKNII